MFLIISKYVIILQEGVVYSATIVVLALISIGMLLYELFFSLPQETVRSLHHIDIVIAWIFLTDFFVGLFFNTSMTKKQYFKNNWLNLISSIPISSELTQTLRIFRIYRATRVIRTGMNFWFAEQRLVTNKHQNVDIKQKKLSNLLQYLYLFIMHSYTFYGIKQHTRLAH